ncbi:c-type cytochrome [Paraburkholderia sp. HP33-1]|uniref:c-type cytochrome n=1 Tax=Paraburkholderia sp. HP33-1 TaxID=2883243 RepID=UPI001F15F34D|nr:c-type cytochrome [Paraburkholderia sp. HP33-1]
MRRPALRGAPGVVRAAWVALLCGGLIAAWLPSGARADAEAGKVKAQVCVACHGPMGNSANPDYPILAGQNARYLYLELKDFKQGRRGHPPMSPMAENLSSEDMQDLADYFAAQTLVPVRIKADGASIDAGRKKAAEVLCTMCHQGGFSGQNEIPRVAGQQYQYIVKQLQDFRSHTRTNDAGNMASVTRNLTDDDIHHLAAYINNLQ